MIKQRIVVGELYDGSELLAKELKLEFRSNGGDVVTGWSGWGDMKQVSTGSLDKFKFRSACGKFDLPASGFGDVSGLQFRARSSDVFPA